MSVKDGSMDGTYGRICAPGFVQRLIQRVKGAPDAGDPEDSCFDPSLQPPGRRSGHGAASIAPYLNQFRSTRPASLD